jgi:hypothetical protein
MDKSFGTDRPLNKQEIIRIVTWIALGLNFLHDKLEHGIGSLQPEQILLDSCGKLRVLRISQYSLTTSTKE